MHVCIVLAYKNVLIFFMFVCLFTSFGDALIESSQLSVQKAKTDELDVFTSICARDCVLCARVACYAHVLHVIRT
jgi:hypothetical protein